MIKYGKCMEYQQVEKFIPQSAIYAMHKLQDIEKCMG